MKTFANCSCAWSTLGTTGKVDDAHGRCFYSALHNGRTRASGFSLQAASSVSKQAVATVRTDT
eukprot:4893548-Prymnesium_polylepis.1